MLKQVAGALALLLLLAAILEAGFRLAGVPPSPPAFPGLAADAPADAVPAYLERRTIAGVDYLYSRWLPSRYYRDLEDEGRRLMRAAKGDALYRVFTFGGSSAAGSPYGAWASFSRFIQDELERVGRPGGAVEVMNFGLSGGRTHEAVRLMRDLARYRPDLVILYAGHNEGCQPLGGSGRGGTAALAGWLAERSRVVAALARRLAPPRPPDPFGRFDCGAELPPEPGILARIRRRFEDNTRAFVGLARGSGAEVLLLSQFSNLFIPPRDFSGPGGGAGGASRGLHLRLAGAFERQDLGAAVELVEAIRRDDPENPHADFYEGLMLVNAGETGRAGALLIRALERDRSPQRFRPSYRAVLAELAGADPQVRFIDLMQAARDRLDDGLVDGRLVIDMMHPNLEGQRLIAETVLREFFKARRPRPDLFDHEAMRPERVYLPVEELDHYHLVCRRYYGLEDWKACVDRSHAEYTGSAGPAAVAEHRRARRAWENLYFYSGKTGDPGYLRASQAIYRSRTEAACRAPGRSP